MRRTLLLGLLSTLVGVFVIAGPASAQTSGPDLPSTPVPGGGPYGGYGPWGGGGGPRAWGNGWGMAHGCGSCGGWNNGRGGWGMMPGRAYGGYPPTQAFPNTTATAAVSFRTDVQPIFDSRCAVCHGGTSGLFLTDYASVMRGGNRGPAVVPGRPAGSRLIRYVQSGYMPYGGPPLSRTEVQALWDWVASGAPDN